MKGRNRNALLFVVSLILLTGLVMGLIGHTRGSDARRAAATGSPADRMKNPLTIKAHLVQDKVLRGSEGTVTLAMTLQASAAAPSQVGPRQAVDLAVVLDRSGSMNGQKIADARRAVQRLIGTLTPRDRLAVVAYSNTAEILNGLVPMTEGHRQEVSALAAGIQPGGGTNLGAGLEAGLRILSDTPGGDRRRKVIILSDGLANQGVTDPYALGRMAARGLANDWVVSTVGLGNDFNEHLMTTLADHGAGTYYYLEDPTAFASVFEKEYRHAVSAAASGVSISVPLHDGVRLIDAGGYPITNRDGRASFNPGNLRLGQGRTFYLTLAIPTATLGEATVKGLQVRYRTPVGMVTALLPETFAIACVESPEEVMASIRKDAWTAKTLQEDFSRLKKMVADAIRDSDEQEAMQRIQAYREEKTAVNQVVASPRVAANLDKEVDALGAYVRETFAGKPEEVVRKQKQNAKVLQYEAYQKRRDKQ